MNDDSGLDVFDMIADIAKFFAGYIDRLLSDSDDKDDQEKSGGTE